jgi:transcriptional regulator with PAS, ATPase and Fis domain
LRYNIDCHINSAGTLKILFSFIGSHDKPSSASALEGEVELGPIVSVIEDRRPDVAWLLVTPNYSDIAKEIEADIKARFPKTEVRLKEVGLKDPTNHLGILSQLRKQAGMVRKEFPDAEYGVFLTSGTPAMHACLLLLVASGEFPARLFISTPSRFLKKDQDRIREVDPTNSTFPEIKSFTEPVDDEEELDWAQTAAEAGICGEDESFLNTMNRAAITAKYDDHVLILGDSGTGKELMADFIHRCSSRSTGPYKTINAGAISEKLIESELFGHVKGAFTGANTTRPGQFMAAKGGTLFIDEIGEMPIEAQTKLLRVLQNGAFLPVGSDSEKKVDVRVVAATNIDIEKAMLDGAFREDLYHRFGEKVTLPNLRERHVDIPTLAGKFLSDWNAKYAPSDGGKRLTHAALTRLGGYHWPGNIRELESVINRAARYTSGTRIKPENIEFERTIGGNGLDALPEPHEGFNVTEYTGQVRKALIDRAIEKTEGNMTKASKLLGVTPQALSQEKRKQP